MMVTDGRRFPIQEYPPRTPGRRGIHIGHRIPRPGRRGWLGIGQRARCVGAFRQSNLRGVLLEEKNSAHMIPERRIIAAELRAKGRRLEGYAAVFGVEARVNDFTESIRPGAFQQSLSAGNDIIALVDHDSARVLARTKSGTLRLGEDTRRLHFSLDVPNTSAGHDVLALAERGDLGGASFGFLVLDEHWNGDHRELRSVDLKEISVVQSFPAYGQTSVWARARPVIFPRVAN